MKENLKNGLLAAGQQASAATCEKLAEDAAQTTPMVVEFQRWCRELDKMTGVDAVDHPDLEWDMNSSFSGHRADCACRDWWPPAVKRSH